MKRQMHAVLTMYVAVLVFCVSSISKSFADDLDVSEEVHEPALEHISQEELNHLVSEDPHKAFLEAFEVGDEIFGVPGNELDGIGGNVGKGARFAKHPRMDLDGPKEWANHFPARTTGPNSSSCTQCHSSPFEDGSSDALGNNVRDPKRTGDIAKFITRQPPHVFGIGAKQRLAEEMTKKLRFIKKNAALAAKKTGHLVEEELRTKGVSFGTIKAFPNGKFDLSGVEGVDKDLMIKPLQWKGSDPSIRAFVRGAEDNELGLQATELVGVDKDGDFDGIVNELGVGDITALAIYQAGQPRPVTKTELAELGIIDPLSKSEVEAIRSGKQVFEQVQCASCHVPRLFLKDPIFSEPSQLEAYRDKTFPSGDDPEAFGLSPKTAVTFDLTRDMPDNIIELPNGKTVHLGNFVKDHRGKTIVDIFSDLKRHDMGEGLAEPVDEVGTGESVFITKALWGIGSTPPYMHDGRAPTITAAILAHGGEAESSKKQFVNLSSLKKNHLVAYLENNILFKVEEEE